MKKSLVLITIFTLSIVTVHSQTAQEEIDYFQSLFGMGKKEIVADFISLDESVATAFWALYDEYETARKAGGQKRLELLADYADSYLKLTDEKTDEIIKSMEKQKNSLDKLIFKYYKKMKKTAGSKTAAQFYQLEYYILNAIRMELLDGIPFIGEINNSYAYLI